MFAELLNSNTEIAHMFVELSTADLVCGSPFRFLTIRNYLLNAPPLRVRSGARDFQSEAHRVQNALNGFEIWTRWPTGKSSIKARSFNSRFFRNV